MAFPHFALVTLGVLALTTSYYAPLFLNDSAVVQLPQGLVTGQRVKILPVIEITNTYLDVLTNIARPILSKKFEQDHFLGA